MDIDILALELLCARFCHDLISPVSAINNGLELMEDTEGDMAAEAMGLVTQSARQAARKLSLLRLAYGPSSKTSSPSAQNVQAILKDYFESSKIKLDWQIEAFPAETNAARMVALSALLGEDALIYGGQLSFRLETSPDAISLNITATGRSAGLRPETQRAFDHSTDLKDLSSQYINSYIIASLGEKLGWTLHASKPAADQWVLTGKYTILPLLL